MEVIVSAEDRIRHIKLFVARATGVPVQTMAIPSRRSEYVQARHLAMYLCKEHARCTLKHIGEHFGGRDHSTVVYGVQRIEDQMSIDPAFRRDVEALSRRIAADLSPIRPAPSRVSGAREETAPF